MTTLLLTYYPTFATRLAVVLQNGVAVEVCAAPCANPSLVGNVYVGKVVRVLSKQSIAFVDIGEKRTALLHFDDCHKPPVQGEKILVQVTKDPIGDKGARLSTHIRLVSHSLVYLPTEHNAVHISKKINTMTARKRLSDTVNCIAERSLVQGGIIVRSNAEFDNRLDEQASELVRQWQTILQQKQAHYRSQSPKLLHEELSFFARIIKERATQDCQIIIDYDSILNEIVDMPKAVVRHLPTLQQTFEIEKIVANALNAKIALPSGGFLVIDEVEAMTVIDVNAGTSNNNAQTNHEATTAIAHAIRLKNISGIIVIDFIDMPKSAQADIVHRLKSATQNDPMQTQVYAFSRLGLLEMTRERVYAPLSKVLTN